MAFSFFRKSLDCLRESRGDSALIIMFYSKLNWNIVLILLQYTNNNKNIILSNLGIHHMFPDLVMRIK